MLVMVLDWSPSSSTTHSFLFRIAETLREKPAVAGLFAITNLHRRSLVRDKGPKRASVSAENFFGPGAKMHGWDS